MTTVSTNASTFSASLPIVAAALGRSCGVTVEFGASVPCTDGKTIRLPFTREAMAVYLGVNQSALSRELSRMQKEGIIRFQGRVFELCR